MRSDLLCVLCACSLCTASPALRPSGFASTCFLHGCNDWTPRHTLVKGSVVATGVTVQLGRLSDCAVLTARLQDARGSSCSLAPVRTSRMSFPACTSFRTFQPEIALRAGLHTCPKRHTPDAAASPLGRAVIVATSASQTLFLFRQCSECARLTSPLRRLCCASTPGAGRMTAPESGSGSCYMAVCHSNGSIGIAVYKSDDGQVRTYLLLDLQAHPKQQTTPLQASDITLYVCAMPVNVSCRCTPSWPVLRSALSAGLRTQTGL